MFTFGFYNSLNGDRKYNSVQISRLFEGIINDGVFASIGDSLMVEANVGMTVNVGTGRAWFDNTWNDNDAVIPFVLDASDVVLNRIDAIVLDVQDASDVRNNQILVVKGTPASVPVAPAMINTTGHHQYVLGTVYVGAGVASIVTGNITNKVGTVDCPFATVVGLDALLPVWEDEFNTWFAALQAQMAGDVATNLQNQITTNANTEKANKTKYGTCATAAATAAKTSAITDFSLVTGVIVGISFTNLSTATNPTLNITTTGAKAIQCCGVAAVSGQIPKNAVFMYDGANYQLLNPAYPPGVVPIANGGTGSTTAAAARTALGVDAAINSSQRDSYMAFCANVNTNSLDAAFGKNNTTRMFNLGLQLAMYAYFKGDSEATYPFTNLKTCDTLAQCLSTGMSEIIENVNVASLIAASPYASPILDSSMETFMATNGTSYCNNSTNFNKIINNPSILASALKSASFRLAMYNNAATTASIIAGSATMIAAMRANSSQYVAYTSGAGASGTDYANKCFVFEGTGWRTGGSGTGYVTYSTFTTGAASQQCGPSTTSQAINRFASTLTFVNTTEAGYTSGYHTVNYFKI